MPRITSRDNLSHTDLVRILGTSAVAALRGGELTSAQKARINRVIDKANKREERKNRKK